MQQGQQDNPRRVGLHHSIQTGLEGVSLACIPLRTASHKKRHLCERDGKAF
jgi:hypothetical protein